MPRVFLTLLSLVLLLPIVLSAQIPGIEAKLWYFGVGSDGLDFNGSPIFSTVTPAKLTDKAFGVGYEGIVVVNDPLTGVLRFYSDGNTVIDASHAVMNNGSGLQGHASGAQTVVGVPMPGSAGEYLLLSHPAHDGAGGSLYSTVVDFTDPSFPLGTIPAATKNVLIGTTSISQGNIVISRPNTGDYWWIGHVFNTQTYHVRAITSAGIGAASVFTFPTLPVGDSYALAYSGITQKLAVSGGNQAGGGTLGLILMDFDPAMGVLSNPSQVVAAGCALGNFSPDGTKLYFGQEVAGAQRLHQYDLNNGVITDMNNCCFAHDTKVAPNGKMYHMHTYNSTTPIAVIDFPNNSAVGNACGYNSNSGVSGTFDGEVRRFPEFLTLPFSPILGAAVRYFEAGLQGGHVLLEWSLQDCKSGCSCVVERSADGIHFQRIGELGQQASQVYRFEDLWPDQEARHYRIQLRNVDGNQHYSHVVTLAADAWTQADWDYFPNPCRDALQIRHAGGQQAEIEVLDMLGRRVLFERGSDGGSVLDVRALPAGSYILRVTLAGQARSVCFKRISE
jgi:hypothetical protein